MGVLSWTRNIVVTALWWLVSLKEHHQNELLYAIRNEKHYLDFLHLKSIIYTKNSNASFYMLNITSSTLNKTVIAMLNILQILSYGSGWNGIDIGILNMAMMWWRTDFWGNTSNFLCMLSVCVWIVGVLLLFITAVVMGVCVHQNTPK
mgnify:CR=1 FL=1